MKYEIIGDDFQILNCKLLPGEKIFAEAGQMIYASDNIALEARARGGIGGILKRTITGETVFLTEFTTTAGTGEGLVAFGKQLGKIVPINLNEGRMISARLDAYMASTENVEISLGLVKRLGAGIFGGKGFILQTFKAKGLDQVVFLEASGQVITLDLKEGQTIKADNGNIVAFESTVDYDIQRVGGIKTIFFGGEGLFLSTLKGPGRVWLQSANLMEIMAKLSFGKK